MIRRFFRSMGLVSVGAFAAVILSASVASAALLTYWSPSNGRLPAYTAQGVGLMQNVTQNAMHSCEGPAWSAEVYLRTAGGTKKGSVSGQCFTVMLAGNYIDEDNVNVWCRNAGSVAKFAYCRVSYT